MKDAWNGDLARAITAVGTSQFHETLLAMMQGLNEPPPIPGTAALPGCHFQIITICELRAL